MSCIWTFKFIYQTTNRKNHTLTHSTSQSRRYGKEATCWRSFPVWLLSSLFSVCPTGNTYVPIWVKYCILERDKNDTESIIQPVRPTLDQRNIYIFLQVWDGQYKMGRVRELVQTRILHLSDHLIYHYIGITETLTVCATLVLIDTRKSIENLIN